LHDEETMAAVVVLMMYVVEMLKAYLQIHQDDCKGEFDQLHRHEMAEAEVVVGLMEELEYVDY
jgi:hypothetical protein